MASVEIAAAPVAVAEPAAWTQLTRVAFRMAFLWFWCFLFVYGNGNLIDTLPWIGDWINFVLMWPFTHLAEWSGQHVFHLTGIAAHWHPTGSGDTTLNWIVNGIYILFAVGGGLLWTAIAALRGNRRTQYQTLYAWLRFLLRLTIAGFMFDYGLAKLFPMQMAPISIAILNEPVGQMSPMTFLWALIGMNPIYESIMGLAEVVGGVLILFRRTALLGALFSSFVLANVVLYNFFFDVPVKLFAVNLLVASLFVVLPDLGALFQFFWLHQPAAPSGVWVPPISRRWQRITLRTVEIIFAVVFLGVLPILVGMGWRETRADARVPTPLFGAWHLDPAHPASGPFLTPEGLPASDIYVDSSIRAFTRSTDGALWRTELDTKTSARTVEVSMITRPTVTYAWQMPDPDHLTLTSLSPEVPKPDPKAKSDRKPASPFTPEILSFTRTPIPDHYPLLDRGFHFVNQWGLER